MITFIDMIFNTDFTLTLAICNSDVDYCFYKNSGSSIFMFGPFGVMGEISMMFICGSIFWFLIYRMENEVENLILEDVMTQNEPDLLVQKSKTVLTYNRLVDPNVEKEEQNIKDFFYGSRTVKKIENSPLIVYSLKKKYDDVRVVDGVSFAVEKGECFGILGISGSGRTTLLKMLATEIAPSEGSIIIGDYELTKHLKFYRKMIGYAPQHAIFYKKLTVTELLNLHANMRGLVGDKAHLEVNLIIETLYLKRDCNILIGKLDPVARRKLAIGIAFMGSPQVVLLDEPLNEFVGEEKLRIMTGIDQLIRGSCVVATFTQIDDCKGFSNRMTIMTHGELKCIGSPTELMTTYGEGYFLVMKMKVILGIGDEKEKKFEKTEYDLEEQKITKSLEKSFPKTVFLKSRHQNLLQYHIVSGSSSREYVFKVTEEIKDEFRLDDYFVTDANLYYLYYCFAAIQSMESTT